MKTATITYHASHNYGSMLQAFALQNIIKQLGFENEIINLRTIKQRKLYDVERYKSLSPNLIKRWLSNILVFCYRRKLKQKYILFERFLVENLQLTCEYVSEEELRLANLDYDCFISGGDQIWNTTPEDFDWSYYLPFVDGVKKISYGVSMGPKAEKEMKAFGKIEALLKRYNHISVREEATKDIVERLIGHSVEVVLDPVLLLDMVDWKKCYNQKPLINGDYILLYVPGYKVDDYSIASIVGRLLGVEVISTIFSIYSIRHHKVRMYCATGPWEFLNLLQHARMVVSGSYHAVIFSMLYQKPFLAVNGAQDNRMRTMLERTGLLSRSVSITSIHKWCKEELLHCDFSQANDYIANERKRSIGYLKSSITN